MRKFLVVPPDRELSREDRLRLATRIGDETASNLPLGPVKPRPTYQAGSGTATPVGSGTVARTKRISIEQRTEAAVIAWMRHQTAAYESMKIARIKGKRREVRQMLAQRSQELLGRYRRGETVGEECPLKRALTGMR
jgi:hypothetical protein